MESGWVMFNTLKLVLISKVFKVLSRDIWIYIDVIMNNWEPKTLNELFGWITCEIRSDY